LFPAHVRDSDGVWEFKLVVSSKEGTSSTDISVFERDDGKLRVCDESIYCTDTFLIPE